MNIEKKRQQEKKIITKMIHLYCLHNNDINEQELLECALLRIQKCPMMATKTFCKHCHIHCYQKEKQEQIKRVMRYSGPRMIFYHPILALRHALKNRRNI